MIMYVVKEGDYLGAIAVRYGISLRALIKANPKIANPDRIYRNQAINIPIASPPEPGGPEPRVHGPVDTNVLVALPVQEVYLRYRDKQNQKGNPARNMVLWLDWKPWALVQETRGKGSLQTSHSVRAAWYGDRDVQDRYSGTPGDYARAIASNITGEIQVQYVIVDYKYGTPPNPSTGPGRPFSGNRGDFGAEGIVALYQKGPQKDPPPKVLASIWNP